MRRFGRYMALIAAWYVLLFFGGDVAWQHFTHHPIPSWVDDVRLILFLCALIWDNFPGYKWFVGKRGGPSPSDAVPESPTAPLVGWRAWRIGGGTGLMSLTTPVVWPSDEPMRATCIRSRWQTHERAPHPECDCGLYVFAGPQPAQIIRLSRLLAVYGPVLTWGRTQVHETGWRAEYAQPLALVRPRLLLPKSRRLVDLKLERIGREYGVPIVSLKEARLLAERFRPSSKG